MCASAPVHERKREPGVCLGASYGCVGKRGCVLCAQACLQPFGLVAGFLTIADWGDYSAFHAVGVHLAGAVVTG